MHRYPHEIGMLGKTVSHYKIIEKLGEGGVGIVYKAIDAKLDRTVALKFLSPELTRDHDAKERFIQEAHAASALDHTNICNIHDIDTTKDGNLFISMAYYEGETLSKMIARGPIELSRTRDFAGQIAEGLAKAHEHGIVHRDVKPGNIMITGDGVAKILDFGLAKLAGHAKITKDLMTRGTIAYMSPEQARGDAIDHRTDVWSLGIVLYEMLTGQPPFKGDYEQAVIYSIVNEEAAPVSSARPDIPLALRRIVEKALRKKPEERYQQMADMLSDIRACAQEVGVSGTTRRGGKGKLQWRRVVISCCAAAALIAAYALVKGHFPTPGGRKIASLAVLPLQNLSADAEQEYFSDGMTEAIITELSRIKALRVISRTSIMRYKKSSMSLAQIARELGVDAVVEGSVQRAGNDVRITAQLVTAEPEKHLWANDFTRNLTNVLELQSEVAQEIAREIKVAVTRDERKRIESTREIQPEALEAYLRGRFLIDKNSYDDVRRGMRWFEQAISIDSTYAAAYSGLAEGYDMLGGLGQIAPRDAWPRVKALAEKALRFDPDLDSANLLIADAMFVFDWDFKSAGKYFRRAIELNPNNARTRSWHALYLMSMGRIEEAIAESRLSIALDPLSPTNLLNYSWLLFTSGQEDSALVVVRESLELEPTASLPHHVIASIYMRQGKLEEAIRESRISLALGDSTALYEVALSYAMCGQAARAREALAALKRYAQRSYVSPVDFATIHFALGEEERAFNLLDEAYELRATDLAFIKMAPFLEGVRRTPRFVEFLKKIGLES